MYSTAPSAVCGPEACSPHLLGKSIKKGVSPPFLFLFFSLCFVMAVLAKVVQALRSCARGGGGGLHE